MNNPSILPAQISDPSHDWGLIVVKEIRISKHSNFILKMVMRVTYCLLSQQSQGKHWSVSFGGHIYYYWLNTLSTKSGERSQFNKLLFNLLFWNTFTYLKMARIIQEVMPLLTNFYILYFVLFVSFINIILFWNIWVWISHTIYFFAL